MFKFLHAADIHLDSPLRGLERYEDAPTGRLRKATRRALENLVSRAIDERVAFLIIAGDLYDGDWKDYNTGLFFVSQMARLRVEGIEVFLIEGNHDAASRITRSLTLPDNVRTFGTAEPTTFHALDGRVALHGQGFATPKVVEELWRNYPPREPSRFNIGVLHTSLAGRPGHEPYAPCREDDLRSKGYDYWALGHVHHREVVSSDPWIVFPGNLQGRHVHETGPKGATLVAVQDDDRVTLEQIELDVLRWESLWIDLAGTRTPEQVLDRVESRLAEVVEAAEDRPVAARLTLGGVTAAHEALRSQAERWAEELRALALSGHGDRLWLEKIVLETQGQRRVEEELAREDALGEFLRSINAIELDEGQLGELAEVFAELRRKLPVDLLFGEDAFDPTDPAQLRKPLAQAKELLLARLLHADEGRTRSR